MPSHVNTSLLPPIRSLFPEAWEEDSIRASTRRKIDRLPSITRFYPSKIGKPAKMLPIGEQTNNLAISSLPFEQETIIGGDFQSFSERISSLPDYWTPALEEAAAPIERPTDPHEISSIAASSLLQWKFMSVKEDQAAIPQQVVKSIELTKDDEAGQEGRTTLYTRQKKVFDEQIRYLVRGHAFKLQIHLNEEVQRPDWKTEVKLIKALEKEEATLSEVNLDSKNTFERELTLYGKKNKSGNTKNLEHYFHVVMTEMKTGKQLSIQSDELKIAARASISETLTRCEKRHSAKD